LAQLLQSYGGNIYNQNLKDVSLLEGIGATQQGQEQNQINAAIQKYLEEKNYPQEQLNTLIKPLQQIQWPSTTTNTQTAPSSSIFGQVLGGLLGGASVADKMGAFGSHKRGGRVRSPIARYKRGGSIRVTSPRTGEVAYVDAATDRQLELYDRAGKFNESDALFKKYKDAA
jgi:hypothetical protein